ncbi:carbohydrate porin [Bradyrhizobium sp. RT9a]|uniref:carbohydrate porin n=1 Tax=Bradyrhizobium sp. RT9a TaxID=3156384 RepID=UPI003392897B
MRRLLIRLAASLLCSASPSLERTRKPTTSSPPTRHGRKHRAGDDAGLAAQSVREERRQVCRHLYRRGTGQSVWGAKQSAVYEDRINFAVDADYEKLVGLKQVTFQANVFQIDGGGLSRGALFNFMDVSGIEALPTTRLYEAWFEKKWGEKIALRAGQPAADTAI